jgi:hypothetical protein
MGDPWDLRVHTAEIKDNKAKHMGLGLTIDLVGEERGSFMSNVKTCTDIRWC